MIGFFKRFLKHGPKATDPSGVGELKAEFKARYHGFKLLLNANREALEVMTELEEALRGLTPVGMHFIRAACTRASSAVFNMIKNLRELAPGRHSELPQKFRAIHERINHILARRPTDENAPLTAPIAQLDSTWADLAGSAMAGLGEIVNKLGLNAPDGFIITSAAQRLFLDHEGLQSEIDRVIQSTGQTPETSRAIHNLITNASIPDELEKEILSRFDHLQQTYGPEVTISMRPSLLLSNGSSFAGQHRQEKNVGRDQILSAYKEIVASKYSQNAMAYRLSRGAPDEEAAVCVGCLVMIDALCGGIAHTRNPLHVREDQIVVSAVFGLAQPLQEGAGQADVYLARDRENPIIVKKRIAAKEFKLTCYGDHGVCRREIAAKDQNKPCLSDEKILELARIAAKIENFFSLPQEFEWAQDREGKISLIQCRPLSISRTDESGLFQGLGEGSAPILARGKVTASPGAACGPAFFLKKDSDIDRFEKNSVLILDQPHPNLARGALRASAILARQGEMAGNLAIAAREFEIPAIFSVDQGLDNIQPGQMITVDADGLAVYDGKLEQALNRPAEPRNLLAGSRIHKTLEEISDLVVPLNLINSDSLDFKPANCKTLHDIARFCHEKAFAQMFSFGQDHSFPERAAKQLVHTAPMQFWIINLDDGFKKDVPGKEVRLSNIVSIPMLPLWSGMVAIPWGGPPPIDAKGFMSILFEATTNPDLDPASQSKYTVRNYFMISKNFCSLESRFGFHFCSVEGLVGERTLENYVTFSFKGGAADLRRRKARARFISEQLEEYGFRAVMREDGLTARLEGKPQAEMERKLKFLGYLIIHTRQVDMIMTDPSAVAGLKEKFRRDLDSILE